MNDTIDCIDRPIADMLRKSLNEAVAEFAKEFGLHGAVVGTHHYRTKNVSFKVELAIFAEDGLVQNKEVTLWTFFAQSNGLPTDGVGRTFISGGKQYRITGCAPRRYRYPISATRVPDGRRFKFTIDQVKRGLQNKD